MQEKTGKVRIPFIRSMDSCHQPRPPLFLCVQSAWNLLLPRTEIGFVLKANTTNSSNIPPFHLAGVKRSSS